MEIAQAAASLFVRQGLRATRAEDIARAAGIAPRTFYRYFATKEEAVAPLYAEGAQRWREAVRTAPAGMTVPQALEHAVRYTLTPGAGVTAASWQLGRALLQLTDSSPALARVWAEVCLESEDRLAEVLRERWGNGEEGTGDGELRFAAAVAGAVVRVAVESWAADESPASGAEEPAAGALRNLAALEGFAWGGA
ncbi:MULTISPECIES: TetR/AcrR family transcriptional regulator [unclassified Streptomyces]|uniref:TetR/AcrR family transcriptional regulator n=1 Tax=unclassified Streptomyces TaxID=2593676 RepID=UPI003825E1F5